MTAFPNSADVLRNAEPLPEASESEIVRRQFEERRRAREASFSDSFAASVGLSTDQTLNALGGLLNRAAEATGFPLRTGTGFVVPRSRQLSTIATAPIDQISDEQFSSLTRGLEEDEIRRIAEDARTVSQAFDIRDTIIAERALQDQIAAGGPVQGLTASLIGELVNPVNIAADIALTATGGGLVAAGSRRAVSLSRASRLGVLRAARSAGGSRRSVSGLTQTLRGTEAIAERLSLITSPTTLRGLIARDVAEGAGTNAAIEALISTADGSREVNLFEAAVSGAVLGGIFSIGLRGASESALRSINQLRSMGFLRAAREVEERVRAMEEAGLTISPEERIAALRDSLSGDARNRLTAVLRDDPEVVDVAIDVMTNQDPSLRAQLKDLVRTQGLDNPLVRRIVLGDSREVVGGAPGVRAQELPADQPPRRTSVPRDPRPGDVRRFIDESIEAGAVSSEAAASLRRRAAQIDRSIERLESRLVRDAERRITTRAGRRALRERLRRESGMARPDRPAIEAVLSSGVLSDDESRAVREVLEALREQSAIEAGTLADSLDEAIFLRPRPDSSIQLTGDQAATIESFETDAAAMTPEDTDAGPRFRRVRFSPVSGFISSTNALVRELGLRIGPDPVARRRADGRRFGTRDNAFDASDRLRRLQFARRDAAFREGLLDFAQASNQAQLLATERFRIAELEQEFSRLVTEEMRGSTFRDADGDVAQSPRVPESELTAEQRAVRRTAERMAEITRNNIEIAARAGVPGAAESLRALGTNGVFVPSPVSPRGLRETIERIVSQTGLSERAAREEVVSLVIDAMTDTGDFREVDAGIVRRVAEWFVDRVERTDDFSDFDLERAFVEGDRQAMTAAMREAGIDTNTEEAQRFLFRVGLSARDAAGDDVGVPGPLRRRIAMDRSRKRTVGRGRTVEVSISDILENDVRLLVDRNSAQLIGAATMQRVIQSMDDLLPEGVPIRDYRELRSAIIRQLNSEGRGREAKALFGDLAEGGVLSGFFANRGRMDVIARQILALPQSDNPLVREFGRRLAIGDFTLNLGKLGLSITADSGRPIAVNGLRTFTSAVPEALSFERSVVGGRNLGEADRVVVAALGRIPHTALFGQAGNLDGSFGHENAVDTVFKGLQDAVGFASFGQPMDAVLRFANVVSAQQRIMRAITGSRGPSGSLRRRMRLSESEFALLRNSVRRSIAEGRIKVERGPSGRVSRYEVPVNALGDVDTSRLFIRALQGLSDSNIQPNSDPALLPIMAQSPAGRVLFRFRSWALINWERGVLATLADPDADLVAGAMLSMGVGAMAYIALVESQTANLPADERREARRDRLSTEVIAMNAFARSNVSGVIPSVAGVILGDITRNSGLSQSLINPNGIPAVATARRVEELLGDTAGLLGGDAFTREDFNNARRLVPLQNTVFGDFAFNAAGDLFTPEAQLDRDR